MLAGEPDVPLKASRFLPSIVCSPEDAISKKMTLPLKRNPLGELSDVFAE